MPDTTFNVTATVVQHEDGTSQVTFQLPEMCASNPPGGGGTTPPPTVTVPAAPLGMAAFSDTSGSLHINVSWQSVNTATAFQLERENVTDDPGVFVILPFSGLTPNYQDFDVVDTKEYNYRVAGKNSAGTGSYSNTANVTAHGTVTPPTMVMSNVGLEAPKNLRTTAQASGLDILTWDACTVPSGWTLNGYNVYRESAKIKSLGNVTTYTLVSGDGKAGARFFVTAVLQMGTSIIETRPSAGSIYEGAYSGFDPGAATAPTGVTVDALWQSGDDERPYNLIRWNSLGNLQGGRFNVYKDAVLFKAGLYVQYCIDDTPSGGDTNTYTVTRVTRRGASTFNESSPTTGVDGTALSAAPASVGAIPGLTIVNNDDSSIVKFTAVSGAKDYRVYAQGTEDYKYSGGHTEIEYNGLTRSTNTTLVVEALGMLGPFHRDEYPKSSPMSMHVNGQGDPMNLPPVIASSTVTAHPTTRSWVGASPIILECFQPGSLPIFVPQNGVEGEIWSHVGATFAPNDASNPWVAKLLSSNWTARYYIADRVNTRVFTGHTHLMDTLFDGGAPGGEGGDPSPPHNNNASLVFHHNMAATIPNAPNVLHVTMEVDAHFDARRWCGIIFWPFGDKLTNPAIQKLVANESPSFTGEAFAWEINSDLHGLHQFAGQGNSTGVRWDLIERNFGVPGSQRFLAPDRSQGPTYAALQGRTLNGPNGFLDRRSRFDIFLNKTQVKIFEEGIMIYSTNLPQALNMTNVYVGYSHHVYHTDNDRSESAGYTDDYFWVNMRPFDDTRHWDNMGFRILSTMPGSTLPG